jgi:hypothetical protein
MSNRTVRTTRSNAVVQGTSAGDSISGSAVQSASVLPSPVVNSTRRGGRGSATVVGRGGGASSGHTSRSGRGAVSVTVDNSNSVYDPAEPTPDASEEGGSQGLKDFVAAQVEGLKLSIEAQVKESQNQFIKNLSGHLAFMDMKLTQKSERPVLKSLYNQRHWDRSHTYKTYIQDALYAIEGENPEEASTHLKACLEALKTYQKEVVLADNSECGWELVSRLGEGSEDREVKALERKILEERRTRKRPRNDGPKDDNSSAAGKGAGASKFGPCVWCNGAGHGYKFCEAWKSDVANGRAVFDTSARKWVRSNPE